MQVLVKHAGPRRWTVVVCLFAVFVVLIHVSHSHPVVSTAGPASHCVLCLSGTTAQPEAGIEATVVQFVPVAAVQVADCEHVQKLVVLVHAIRPPPTA